MNERKTIGKEGAIVRFIFPKAQRSEGEDILHAPSERLLPASSRKPSRGRQALINSVSFEERGRKLIAETTSTDSTAQSALVYPAHVSETPPSPITRAVKALPHLKLHESNISAALNEAGESGLSWTQNINATAFCEKMDEKMKNMVGKDAVTNLCEALEEKTRGPRAWSSACAAIM